MNIDDSEADLYLAIHTHKEGWTSYLITTFPGSPAPTVEQVVAAHHINFEPDCGGGMGDDEFLEIEKLEETDFVHIETRPGEMEERCDDSPDGKHEFTQDLEYDPSGGTLNCEHCGQQRTNKGP